MHPVGLLKRHLVHPNTTPPPKPSPPSSLESVPLLSADEPAVLLPTFSAGADAAARIALPLPAARRRRFMAAGCAAEDRAIRLVGCLKSAAIFLTSPQPSASHPSRTRLSTSSHGILSVLLSQYLKPSQLRIVYFIPPASRRSSNITDRTNSLNANGRKR